MLALALSLAALLVTLVVTSTAAAAPTLTTDKADYAPGEVVQVSGSWFAPNTKYSIPIKRPDGSIVLIDPVTHLIIPPNPNWGFATSDGAGNLRYAYQLDGIDGLYEARAYSSTWAGNWSVTPVAAVTFTDAVPKNTICHSTGSATNPYSRIVTAGIAGHEDHTKDIVFTGQETSCPSRFTLNKVCAMSPGDTLPANQQFTFTIPAYNGQTTRTLACGTSDELAIGVGPNKTITETAGNLGTDLSNYTTTSSCTITTSTGSTTVTGNTSITFNVPYYDSKNEVGAAVECTFTNTKKPPNATVAVTKSCPNNANATTDRFQVKLGANNVGDPLACGGSLNVTVPANTNYTITEAAAGTTDFSNYETPQYSAGCSSTTGGLAGGGSATCTITNTLKANPVVTVTKACPDGPDADTDRFQVKLGTVNQGDP
ncbi:MAG: hypothetical protein H0U03_14370, partial [Actinobacteria bacterium]|nr:hypothetical protein [Actinomycetota bacterium]